MPPGGRGLGRSARSSRDGAQSLTKLRLEPANRWWRRLSFADEMAAEYRVSVRMVHRHDFIEGVRALIVDKDNSPRWDPATLSGVSEEVLDAIFAELPPDEEWTPLVDAA